MIGMLIWAFTMIKVCEVSFKADAYLWSETEVALQRPILLQPVLPFTDGGDMDARDYVRMRYEKRLREGREDTSGHNQSIGSFEKFTKVRMWCKYLIFTVLYHYLWVQIANSILLYF